MAGHIQKVEGCLDKDILAKLCAIAETLSLQMDEDREGVCVQWPDPADETKAIKATRYDLFDDDGNYASSIYLDANAIEVTPGAGIELCTSATDCAVIDCPDPCTDITVYINGRPPASFPWAWGPYNGTNLNDFEDALMAGGYTVLQFGEIHAICGVFEDPDALLYVNTEPGDVPPAVIPNPEPGFVAVDTCALQTTGKDDDRRDNLLAGILDKLCEDECTLVTLCDSVTEDKWLVNVCPDGSSTPVINISTGEVPGCVTLANALCRTIPVAFSDNIVRYNVAGTWTNVPADWDTLSPADRRAFYISLFPAAWSEQADGRWCTTDPGESGTFGSCTASGLSLACGLSITPRSTVEFCSGPEGEFIVCEDAAQTSIETVDVCSSTLGQIELVIIHQSGFEDVTYYIDGNGNIITEDIGETSVGACPPAGESCDAPIFTKECPPEPCPPPSIELFCDPDDTKYIIVGHALEACGTSGTFVADDYYADPQVLTPFAPTGVPAICPDAVIKEQECLVDECGDRWTCVTVITPAGGTVVESQTCVPYVENPDCADTEAIIGGRAGLVLEGKRQAVKSLTSVKSIKLTVTTINTQITEVADPVTFALPVPVGETCPCPCPEDIASTTSFVADGCYNGQPATLFVKSTCADENCEATPAVNLLTNGELEGPIGTSASPTGWAQIPFSDPVSDASSSPRDTSDTTGATGPNVTAGLAGTPHGGTTFVSGLHSNFGAETYHEGIQQNVTGLVVGDSYQICFWQAVVQQTNVLGQTGYWDVYFDSTLAGSSAPVTTTQISSTDLNLNWVQSCVTFVATATSHDIKFLPKADDITAVGVRMGIDDITLIDAASGSSCCVEIDCVAVVLDGTTTPIIPDPALPISLGSCRPAPSITTELEWEYVCILLDGVKGQGWQVIETVYLDGVETSQNIFLLDLAGDPADGEVVACDPDFDVLQAEVCDEKFGTLIAVTVDGTTTYYDPVKGSEVTPSGGTLTAGACAIEVPSNHLIEGCILVGGVKTAAFTIVDHNGAPLFAPKPLTSLGFEEDCC